jgi:intracellular septation protein A
LDNRKMSRWTPFSHILKLTHGVALQQVASYLLVPLAVATCKALVYKERKVETSHLALQLLVVTSGALPLTPISSNSRLVPTLSRCTA